MRSAALQRLAERVESGATIAYLYLDLGISPVFVKAARKAALHAFILLRWAPPRAQTSLPLTPCRPCPPAQRHPQHAHRFPRAPRGTDGAQPGRSYAIASGQWLLALVAGPLGALITAVLTAVASIAKTLYELLEPYVAVGWRLGRTSVKAIWERPELGAAFSAASFALAVWLHHTGATGLVGRGLWAMAAWGGQGAVSAGAGARRALRAQADPRRLEGPARHLWAASNCNGCTGGCCRGPTYRRVACCSARAASWPAWRRGWAARRCEGWAWARAHRLWPRRVPGPHSLRGASG